MKLESACMHFLRERANYKRNLKCKDSIWTLRDRKRVKMNIKKKKLNENNNFWSWSLITSTWVCSTRNVQNDPENTIALRHLGKIKNETKHIATKVKIEEETD